MQENENGFNLDLLDLRGSEGAFDYCSKTNTIIYSVGSMIVYWELQKEKKLFINYHESTIASIKISHSGNYFISIDKNKFPNIIFWEIPSLNIIYQNKLSVNFRSNKDEFPEETRFLREQNNKNTNKNFNLITNLNKNSSLIINDAFIEFLQSNSICVLINVEFFEEDSIINTNRINNFNLYGNNVGNNINRGYNRKQIFYFFEIINSIYLKFFKIIDKENHALSIKAFLNGNIITMEDKLLKFWKIDYSQNKLKLKTKIHIKQKLMKNQLQICEYLKMIIILNENSSCLILDETGVFLLSINPDFGPLNKNNKFIVQGNDEEKTRFDANYEIFTSIIVYNETLFLTTSKGNILIYNLNGFKFLGKIEYDYSLKKKFLLNHVENKNLNKIDFNFENLEKNKNDENNNFSNGFFIKTLFIDENCDIIITNYSDNSINIFPLSKTIKNKNILLGSKYKRNNNTNSISKYENLHNQYNLELNNFSNNLNKNYFLYSHFEKITDICWLNNNFKSFVTCSTDQSIMLWNYRGDKWINEYFDLLKIFDKNLNNYENQVLKDIDDISNTNLEFKLKKKEFAKEKNNFNFEEIDERNKFSNTKSNIKNNKINYIFGVKYYITVIKQHPKRQDLLIAGDNKGNIFQFDVDLRSNPKKFVVGNFAINSLSFSRNGNFLAIGFCTGNIILVDFNNNCKFCCVIEEFNNEDAEIKARNSKRELLSYSHIFKKYSFIENNNLNINPANSQNLNNLLKNSETESSTVKILSMNSYKTLRIQLVKKSVLSNNINNKGIFDYNNLYNKKYDNQRNIVNGGFFNSTIKNFNYNYKIKKIEMHVSEDYLIILFENNNILINKIESNIISGLITINNQFLEFYDIKTDPSGLYLAVLSDAFANQELLDFELIENKNEKEFKTTNKDLNRNLKSLDKNRSIDFNSNINYNNNITYYSTNKNNGFIEDYNNKKNNLDTNDINISLIKDNIRKRSSIILYEIGTGNFVSIMKNIFVISNFKFSNDGRFLCVTSDSGCVSVWNTNGEIRENIFSVLEEMKINPNFWDNFRINFSLENAEKLNFFQKIKDREDDVDKNVNLNLIRSYEDKIKEKKSVNQNIDENKLSNRYDNFSKSRDDKNIKSNENNYKKRYTSTSNITSKNKEDIFNEKRTISNNKKTTSNNNNRVNTNLPDVLNNGKITTSYNQDETSYRSLYLNYENTNNYNSENLLNKHKLTTNFNNLNKLSGNNDHLNTNDINILNRSSRGRIYSNYPTRKSDDNIVKLKNSNAFSEKNTKSNSKEKLINMPNMLYSSSNLYKKNFQVEEFSNLDKRSSNTNINKITSIINNPIKTNVMNNNFDKNSTSENYVINFTKNKMIENVFPDPDDIDDLDEDNYANLNNNYNINNKGLSSELDKMNIYQNSENITEDNLNNSKNKGSTADQIEFFENNINYFEKNVMKKKEKMNNTNSYMNNSRLINNSENRFEKGNYLKDSIDIGNN